MSRIARRIAAIALAVAGVRTRRATLAVPASTSCRRRRRRCSATTRRIRRCSGSATARSLWRAAAGRAGKSCADCHGDAKTGMRGVAARYPSYDVTAARPLTLAQRVDACRVRHQEAPALAPESRERLALESYVALQSRGMPIAPPDDARLAPYRERGEKLWRTRVGQLDPRVRAMPRCACRRASRRQRRSAGASHRLSHLPAGMAVARVARAATARLPVRRARPGAAAGAIELVELEVWLAARAAGMAVDAPGVRP
jgi:sulfur-oxidizing protein SoxA